MTDPDKPHGRHRAPDPIHDQPITAPLWLLTVVALTSMGAIAYGIFYLITP